MKKNVIIVLILLSAVYLFSDEKTKYVPTGKAVFPPFVSSQNHGSTRQAPEWSFAIPPLSLLTSYYDYMIGGENNLPVQIQSNEAGAGCYLTYHGKRSTSSPRRVFYTYFEHNFNVVVNNEITYAQVDEGFPAVDIDEISGKPIFAWHSNANATDNEMEVSIAWDAYLEGIPGLISEPTISLNNPLSITTTNGITTTDNEFIKPSVQIGPSPLPGHRRVYVLARNNTMHNGYPSENPIIFWADFTPVMLEEGTILTWNIIHIPELDEWNVDQAVWRQPFGTLVTGNDDRIYYVGYHTTQSIPGNTVINETDLDVFACNNYGQGTWQHYTALSNIPSWNPPAFENGPGFFLKSETLSYQDSEIFWKIRDSGHLNAIIDENGFIHMHAMWVLSTIDNTYFPEFNTIKEMIFNVSTNQFDIREVYPIAGTSSDGATWQPWDTDGNGSVDQYEVNGPLMQYDWNYCYWDDTAHDGAMRYLYNNIKVTEPNSQGWMASVWQNSRRARAYNTYNEFYPEYWAYQFVPEIYISISADNGANWSDPIIMNSVETQALSGNRPMWVYPADKIKDIGMVNGHHVGRLGLMYYHDNTWGASVLEPHVGPNDGGVVKYMSIDIEFPESGTPGLSGTIRNNSTHLPIANATISAGQYSATSNLQGLYSLNLPSGTYQVTVSANGYITQTVNNIVISGYMITNYNFSLIIVPPLITVSGIVVGGNPPVVIPNATIHLLGTPAYSGLTNDLGAFSIPNVWSNQQYQYYIFKQSYSTVTGTIHVQLTNYDMGTISLVETYNPPSHVVATVSTSNDNVNVSWQLPTRDKADLMDDYPVESKVHIQEMRYSGQQDRNLLGYLIWRLPSEQQDNEETWTAVGETSSSLTSFMDLDWAGVEEGVYRYAVKAQYSSGVISPPSFSHAIFRFVRGSMIGNVHDQDQFPISSAMITLTKILPDGTEPFTTMTDVNGNYSFLNIHYGSYHLTCTKDHYQAYPNLDITVVANHTLEYGFALTDSLQAPTDVVAQNNLNNTVAALSWQSPFADELRALNGYNIWRFLVNDMGNSNLWTYIGRCQDATHDDPSWESVAPGLYKYAVCATYSGNHSSSPSFSNTLEKPVDVTDPTDTPSITRIISASPNPFYSTIHISYEMKTDTQPKFEIFNINGQRIRTLKNISSKIGNNQITWDGTTDKGEKVTSGIYIYRMIADSQVFNRKIILLK